ncbi:enoyl-CoA hydratase/carnithine racemase [Melghiribacillus thermohalophilus]|uniref:Enoyl-CoA hydratase/carnithine racemase n=1 Tax=Melghiribacillus thermohalophilus TaxID=1324956 RepID=A0A4R3NBR1_9BACI|nr:enoyl-CoA hydratase/isomerase family protein [Melghiribacillus thermohalophilus]TCT26884.1 enoyl-CoA hydratase/carnithine racemase [Melghiribacillus thermohalophilus]
MFETIHYEVNEAGYIVVRLNRPDKRNAVSLQMVEELREALDQAKKEDIKCLVITGTGDRAFCSGGDLTDFHGDMSEMDAYHLLGSMKNVLYQIMTFPVPTICLLNGAARGGGCELATSCDFRLARQHTDFGFVQGKLGITPGWGGGALLYQRISPVKAHYWLVTSQIFDAETLKEWGWIDQIIPDEIWNKPTKFLEPFIEKYPEQMRTFKKQFLSGLSLSKIYDEMEKEVLHCARLWDSEPHRKAVEDFLRKK